MSAEAVGLGAGSHFQAFLARPGVSRVRAALSVSSVAEDAILSHRDVGRPSRGWLGTLLGGGSTRRASVIHARVLAVEGQLLIVEYESPFDAFLAPNGEVVVICEGRPVGEGTIDHQQSSPRGPHARGLLLRLAIVGSSSWTSRVGDEVTIAGGAIA